MAELREKYPERKIFTVDTLCASLGQGLLVWQAAALQKAGRSLEEVRDWAEANKLKLCHWVAVDESGPPKAGRPILPTTALVGGMLSIKPIIHVDNEGHLINVGKVRGRAASLKHLVDEMEKRVTNPREQIIFISHSDCLEDARVVGEEVKRRFGVKDVVSDHIGPVIGAHTGPGQSHSSLWERSGSMEDIKWLEVAIDTTTQELEALSARLTMNGVTGLVIEDEADFQQFLQNNRQYWDYVDEELQEKMRGVCRIKFYVSDDADGRKQLRKWMEGIEKPYTTAALGRTTGPTAGRSTISPWRWESGFTSFPSGSGRSLSRRERPPSI